VTYYWLISRQARQAYLNRLAVYAPSLKLHGRHVIYFDHFSDMLKFPRKTREQAMQQVIQHYAECLQTYCLKEPLQWFNFFDFWRVAHDDE